MFTEHRDNTQTLSPIPVRAIVVSLGVICFGLLILVLYLATDGFTRGEIRDLPTEEKLVLDQIEQAGVLVRDATIACTMQPHIVVSVNFQRSTKKYAVTAIGLRSVPLESIASHIMELSSLKEIRAPYSTSEQIEAIQRRVPGLTVNRRDD